jgi:hypothetical protein
MNIDINIAITGDNGGNESYAVRLNQDELTNIVRTEGIEAGNKALDKFCQKFLTQFKEKLGSVLNR